MRRQLANITVIGRDKTGVVARVTGYLFESGANIDALEEQVTRGQFSMTILASWDPERWNPAPLRRGLHRIATELGMEISLRIHTAGEHQRMALFVTKEPHCLDGILEELAAGRLKTEIATVIGNHRDLQAKVEKAGLPFKYISWSDRRQAESRALKHLEQVNADFIVLARFMKILSPNFVWRFKNKILNIHPSLLPSFPGPQAYRQAYEHGVKIAGVTAHFVSMHLDEGPIIAQSSFEIKPGASLREIVQLGQATETKVLLKAIKLYLANRLDVHWGIVRQI